MSALTGLVLVQVLYEQGGPTRMWTCHGRTADNSVNTQAKMAGLADEVDAAITAGGLKALLSDDVNYLGVRVDDVSPAGLASELNTDGNGPGTDGGAAATALSALTITKRTALSGRAGRGRSYFGGMSFDRATNEGTEWVQGYVDAIQTLYQAFLDAFSFATPQAYNPVLYHRTPDTVSTITDHHANSEIYRQSRRTRT